MEEIQKVLLNWSIAPQLEISQIYRSAWSVGTEYILKRYEDNNEIFRNIEISRHLRNEGVPAMETIKTQSGDDYFILGGQYYILMKCLPGKHIENIYESDYIRIAQVSGEIIGRLHLALLKCQSRLECYENDLGNEINGWVSRYFVDNGYSYISRAEVEQLCSEILIVSRDLPRQLIHRDIHFGNLLFEEETITGYIDFDLSQVNIRIFDICYFSLGLLVEAFKDDSKSEKWFIMLESILAGYDKVNSLQRQERKAAVCVMQCIELLFVAFFAQNGNSELAQGAADMYRWVEKNQEKIRNIFY